MVVNVVDPLVVVVVNVPLIVTVNVVDSLVVVTK